MIWIRSEALLSTLSMGTYNRSLSSFDILQHTQGKQSLLPSTLHGCYIANSSLLFDFLSQNFKPYLFRWMYWCDWGEKPRVNAAWLDGTNMQTIETFDIHYPNRCSLRYTRGIVFSRCHGAVNFDVFEPMP